MKSSKLTKFIAALALAAVGSATWSSNALATSCQSGFKPWNTTYVQNCYVSVAGNTVLVAKATGEGYTNGSGSKSAWIFLNMGSSARIQVQNSNGGLINSCGATDVAADGYWVADTSFCSYAATFVVDVTS